MTHSTTTVVLGASLRASVLASVLALGSACGGVHEGDGDGGNGDDDGGMTADDGGDAGDDGAGVSLAIESISPRDGTTDASRIEPLVITFSEPIDPDTVAADTVEVTAGPAPVAGALAVDGDRVTFTPAVQWHLLGDIHVAITTGVAGVSGAVLPGPRAAGFRIEDGAWQDPVPIASDVGCCASAVGNRRGDIVFPFVTGDRSIRAVRFDAASQAFAPAVPLEALGRAFESPVAAIDGAGDAIVIWRGQLNVDPQIIGWSRLRGGDWTGGQIQEVVTQTGDVVLGDDGTALDVWWQGNADIAGTRLAPGGDTWAAPAVLEPGAYSWGVYRAGGQVQMIFERAEHAGLFSRTLDPASGDFGAASLIGAEGAEVNYVNHTGLEDGGALFSWWQVADDEIHFGRFDGKTGQWSGGRLGDGQGGSQVCEDPSGARIGTFHDGGTVLAARAAPGQAFGLAEDLGTQTGLDFSGCFLDRFGHGHGLWGGYGTDRIFWARYHADGTWDDAIEVATAPALRGWFADAFGNLTLVYVDGTQAFARRFR